MLAVSSFLTFVTSDSEEQVELQEAEEGVVVVEEQQLMEQMEELSYFV